MLRRSLLEMKRWLRLYSGRCEVVSITGSLGPGLTIARAQKKCRRQIPLLVVIPSTPSCLQ